ncbi:MAG TPA: aminotransferase class I/II-fold pyridoxal phosphate-dependent enzyme [Gemmatimonadaceae bacterium]|jgi:L-2,4-diaminobutyrate decarboxylase|nr:aminotransferase class I/II-fold pyridoxal phosphate-dependent enzyme [Gemmatimonadaceae bacterium]
MTTSARAAPALASPNVLAEIEADCTATVGRAFVALAAEYFEQTKSRDGRVSSPHTAAGLAARFEEAIPRAGHSVEAILARLRSDVIPDCNHLYHPRYAGHQMAGPLPSAVWMESITAALNQSVAVFEMSPVGTALEHRVIAWMCSLAGFGAGAGGTMTTGGTEATFTALLAARGAVMPDAWTNGVGSDPPVVLCGEHAHYAVTRTAAELGLGLRNVLPVRSRDFKMDTEALRRALEELARRGRRVMAVVATAGSTATGAFDDLQTIGATCEEHGVWMHVDAAHGGSALLSPAHRHRLRGIERARSIAWDPHKMMLMPTQAGMLLVRDERDLDAAFSQRAPYLFHGEAGERVWDNGTRNFICSRRAEVFKLWVALQRYGVDGFAELHDYFCALARFMWDEIAERADFEAMHAPESNILCFRYLGDAARSDAEHDRVNRELRERYNLSGEGWITATNLDGRRVLRVTLMNPRTTAADVRDILDGLAEIGRTL